MTSLEDFKIDRHSNLELFLKKEILYNIIGFAEQQVPICCLWSKSTSTCILYLIDISNEDVCLYNIIGFAEQQVPICCLWSKSTSTCVLYLIDISNEDVCSNISNQIACQIW